MSTADILAAIEADNAAPRDYIKVVVPAWSNAELYFDPRVTVKRYNQIMRGIPAGDVAAAAQSYVLHEACDKSKTPLFLLPETGLPDPAVRAQFAKADGRLFQAILAELPDGPSVDAEKKD